MNRNTIVFGATVNTGIEICKVLDGNKLNNAVIVRKDLVVKRNNYQLRTQ